MKKTFALIFLNFITYGTAQNENKGIEFHNISFSPLNIYFADRDFGFGQNLDVSFNLDNHIFKLYAGRGSEFVINFEGDGVFEGESINNSFGEYNLLYGRELEIKNWFGIDLFAGLGFFHCKYDGNSSREYTENVIGFPLQSKIRFNTGRTFSLGLQLNTNINSATTIYQAGIFLQWKL